MLVNEKKWWVNFNTFCGEIETKARKKIEKSEQQPLVLRLKNWTRPARTHLSNNLFERAMPVTMNAIGTAEQ